MLSASSGHVVRLAAPVLRGSEVKFAWELEPRSELYERNSFSLRFPPGVDPGAIAPAIWWRVALICLHPHWALLRPCTVVLPVRLPEGEREAWMRLIDAACWSLDVHADTRPAPRAVELICSGELLELQRCAAGAEVHRPVSCFSGGRDSITQAAMLCEIGLEPTLVTTTAPVTWSREHDTPRRREVFAEIQRRLGLELVEVSSDLRSGWKNGFGWERSGIGVNELTDALLYIAVAVALAAARGASLVLMASEAEVQENSKRGGKVIQMPHFMYSAATHRSLASLLEPTGIRIGSLTNSLRQFQVQRLLSERYGDLRDLQYSCWELSSDQAACSRCQECRGIALNLLAAEVSPREAGIDLGELLLAFEDWEPGERAVKDGLDAATLPRRRVSYEHEMQELRALVATPPDRVARLLDSSASVPFKERAVEAFVQMRDRAQAHAIEPEPGFREGYLELLEPSLRSGVRSIVSAHFSPAPEASYAKMLANTRLLSDWVAAPLRRTDGIEQIETDPLAELMPAPEPVLVDSDGFGVLRVAETALEGNELAYTQECITSNWISSAGPFVRRFEQEFAAAVGAAYGVACSSGTAALHLALAAAGISRGDEVIMPTFTMVASANAALYVGAAPVLIDSDQHSWNLDPTRLVDKLSPRTRAVVVVHTYGQPADMDAVRDFAARNGLLVIEDAAEAHGATYRGQRVGSIGDVAAFSFYGNKIIATGEGGIVTTNDERIASRARELRDHAFSADRHFWHRRLGFNYRMTNLQAAVGVAQTERFDELLARRAGNGRRYREALDQIEGLELPPALDGAVMWMFGVRIHPEFGIDRDELRRRLAARGVETRTFFVPLHAQPVLRQRFRGQRYPVAEELGRTGLYLPSGPGLCKRDIDYVADAVRAARKLAVSSA